MRFPERLRVCVLADRKPAVGMFVCVTIRTIRKIDFELGFAPTNEKGEIVILRKDLLREAERERKLFIMEYPHPEDDFTGELVVTPLNREVLAPAIAAYDTYQQTTPYPPRYAEQLQEPRMLLNEVSPKRLSVEIEQDGETIVVRGESVVP